MLNDLVEKLALELWYINEKQFEQLMSITVEIWKLLWWLIKTL